MNSFTFKQAMVGMVSASQGNIRTFGREAVFAAMEDGRSVMLIGSRIVSVKVLNIGDIKDRCRWLTDDEVGEYLAYVMDIIGTQLLETKGRSFFSVAGGSSFTLLVPAPPFRELKTAVAEAVAEEEQEAAEGKKASR